LNDNTSLDFYNLLLYVRAFLQYPRAFSKMQTPRLPRDSIIFYTGTRLMAEQTSDCVCTAIIAKPFSRFVKICRSLT